MIGIHPFGDGFYGDPGFFYLTGGAQDVTGAASITLGSTAFVTRFMGTLDATGASSITLGEFLSTLVMGAVDDTGAATVTLGEFILTSGGGSGTTLTIDPLYVLGDFVSLDPAVWGGDIGSHPFATDGDFVSSTLIYVDGYITLGEAAVSRVPAVENPNSDPKAFWHDVTPDWKVPTRPRGLVRRRGW